MGVGSCPVCRCCATSHLQIFFPGELLPNALVAAAPPAAKAQDLKVPNVATGVLALPDIAHVDAERFSDVEAIEEWMLCYPSLDDMPIEDGMDLLNIALTEQRP